MQILTRPEGTEPGDLNVSRRLLGGLFFAGYAAAAVSAQASPITTDERDLKTGVVMIPSFDRAIPAYIARPDARGKFPTVLVVSEVFGVHEYIRDTCRRLAKLGYVAIAPDFFVRHGDPAPLTDFGQIRKIVGDTTDAETQGDVNATVAWLNAQKFVDPERKAITGFCWGGAVVWLACARARDFRCGVAWYGRLDRPAPGQFLGEPEREWPLDKAGVLKCPVLGLYAGKDQGIPAKDIEAMREILVRTRKVGSDIIVYPNAQHGFHADYRATYDEAAARDGWARMLAYFAQYGVAGKRF
ncbi:MAG: dienelactone hydrolase family protein [Caulobacteraceae bacterium]|nr:MAG: dienelactone hydrolase family protein [Caulobacteraceae bacterium]